MLTEDRTAVFSYHVEYYFGGRMPPASRVGQFTAHIARSSRRLTAPSGRRQSLVLKITFEY